MTIDRYTKVLMTIFTLALLLNGLNSWINPSQAVAIENTSTKGTKNSNDCSSQDRENNIKTLERMNNLERLLGYIESSVNNIQLTIKGIDRKVSEFPSRNATKRE
jgi:hypothetical protein|tara:strand:- start:1914 stop:2228 length:315 start_codon:yes stop_codon:yes gene_type:complete